jgi:endonuclease YncB( thermonuclease family)
MIIFLIAFLFSFNVEAKNLYVYKVEKITDGDTIKLDTSKDGSLLKELGLSVRIYGVDTPEKGSRAKCKKENDLANLATEFTTNLVGKREIMLDVKKWDKFGGRILAIVQVGGLNIADELIKRNLAVPYFGDKKEKDWCK